MPKHYEGIFGWFDFDSIYREVNEKFNDALFCEVGSFQGKSACYMAELIKESGKNNKLVCVDLWPTREELEHKKALGVGQGEEEGKILGLPKSILETFCDNMDAAGVRDIVYPIRQDSSKVADIFPDSYFSFIFIDAGHSYDQVTKDLKQWFPKLKPGGIFAGHDYYADVSRAVKDYFGYELENKGGSFYMVKQ
jgi:predicted O-methyltransferase YrrM